MFRSIRARELDPGGRLGARGGCASTSSSCRAPTLGWPEKELGSWAEADALSNCTATYSDLRPAPRSTIAAAFSPDGKLLASTHGDHTVKLIDCRTGRCVRTLTGHRRTPWVVRYHPTDPNVLASGSLDHQVRVWNATTAECVVCFDFAKPIASLAFHAEGDVLAVASGHKLYTYNYTKSPHWRRAAAAAAARENPDEADAPAPAPPAADVPFVGTFPSRGRGSTAAAAAADDPSADPGSVPCISLRTRRSLRAVHFHPHGAPLILTAEVNETSEQDVPPLRAMTAPRPAGEWEKAYAAAASAAAAAVRGDAAPEPERRRSLPTRIARRRARRTSRRDLMTREFARRNDSRRTLWVAFGFVRPARRPPRRLVPSTTTTTRARRNNVARRRRRRRWRWAT